MLPYRVLLRSFIPFAALCWPALVSAQTTGAALVRHAPTINGTIDGSVQQMLPEPVTLNGGAVVTGDLLVPGTPTVRLNGRPTYDGTLDGAGATAPTDYQVTLNGNTRLGHVVRRTDAVALPTVAPVPQPSGTRIVTINAASQSAGDFATLRHLTLNGNVGQYAVPPGTYGDFTANGGSGFTLGVAGSTRPVVYNFQRLTLNGQTEIRLAGPVIINLANGLAANGALGSPVEPRWLALNIFSGGFTLNGGAALRGYVTAPNSTVTINGNSQLIGGVITDRLVVNGGGLLRLRTAVPFNQSPIAESESVSTPEDTPKTIALRASDPDGDALAFRIVTEPAYGSLSGSGANRTYSPAANFSGTDTFSFQVNDGTVDSAVATITITVIAVNDVPSAHAKTVVLDEDGSIAILLTGSDVETRALNFITTSHPRHGTLSGTGEERTYTPFANYHGPDSFTYIAHDGTVPSEPATVSITVRPINDAPSADSLTLAGREGTGLAVTLAGRDVDGDAITFIRSSSPAHGTISGTPPNLIYTSLQNFSGVDRFTYRVNDGQLDSEPATVTLAIDNPNDPPRVQPVTVATPEDTPHAITLTGTDPDGNPLTFHIVAPPEHGTLAGTPPTLSYRPAENYVGSDRFTYKARDAEFDSNIETVSITITPVNDRPVATAQSLVTLEDAALAITLAGTDIENSPLTFQIVESPANGTLTGNGANYIYTPRLNYHGADRFTFKADDGELDSAPVEVSVSVTPQNDPPTAQAQTVATPEDTAVAIVLAGSDVENSALTFEVVTPPQHGTFAMSGATLVYTPAENYHGNDSFTFKVNDGELDSLVPALVTLTIDARNDTPVASNQAVSVLENDSVSLTLGASDVDGDPLTYDFGSPAHGTLTGTAPNLTYRPSSNYVGADSFSFRATDPAGAVSNEGTISITVIDTNSPPVAFNQAFTLDEDRSQEFTLDVRDPDSDPLTYTLVTPPAHGSLVGFPAAAVGAPPRLTYVPAADYTGTDRFTYRVRDGGATQAEATVAFLVRPVNDTPVVYGAQLTVAPGAAGTVELIGTDADGDPLTFVVVGTPLQGTASIAGSTLTYRADATATGFAVINFRATDASASSEIASVLVTIKAAGGPPPISAGGERTVWVQAGASGRPGTIIVNNDEWTLSDQGFINAPTVAQFARNVADWFKRGATGKFLVYSDNFGLRGNALANTIRAAGHTWVLQTSPAPTLESLRQYDAVFLCGIPMSADVLHAYVREGGSIYLCGQGYGQDQTWWNPFLAEYGLRFGPVNPVFGTAPVTSSHPLLAGVQSLFYYNGNDVELLPTPNVTNNEIIHKTGQYNLISAYTTGRFVVEVAGSFLQEASDFNPAGATYQWSFVEGPGLVRFSNSAALVTSAYVSAPGTYRLRLTVTNSAGSTSADTILHLRQNVPPLVTVGTLASPVVGQQVTLPGSAADDGNPNPPASFTARWIVVQGPGQVSLSNAQSPATSAIFATAGDYVLKLEAHDGEATSSALLNVRVTPVLPPNSAPVVYAPATVPARTNVAVRISGSAVDDGLPVVPGTVSYQWSKVTGPGTVTWSPATAAQTDAIFSLPGEYTIRLTASDGQLQGVANVTVNVVDAPVVNRAPTVTIAGVAAGLAGQAISLTGTATDDGLPANGPGLTYTWARAAGPGTAAFSSPAQPATQIVFEEPGLHVVRLLVSDGELAGFAEISISISQPGVINRAPVVTLPASFSATLGMPLALTGTAVDDGLPTPPGGVVYRWLKMSGPGGISVSAPTAPSTMATFHANGQYVVRLVATDGVLSGHADVVVSVQAPADPVPPQIALYEPLGIVPPNQYFEIAARATHPNGLIRKVEFFSNGIKLGEQTLPAAGDPTTYFWPMPTGLPAGNYTFTARATDHLGIVAQSVPREVRVTNEPPPVALLAEVSSPSDSARITAPTAFRGVIAGSQIAHWSLEYRLLESGPAGAPLPWTGFASGTNTVGTPATPTSPAAPGMLGTFDPTQLLNGIYEVRLALTDTSGSSTIDGPFPIVVEGNMKTGAFSIAFEDLKVPVAGIPISITRTYDSRDARVGDFGPGWRIALNNIRVQKNRNLGTGWWQTLQAGTGIQFYHVEPLQERIVTVTMPDGETHRFRAGAKVNNRVGDPDNSSFAIVVREGLYKFYPLGDTTATLEPLDSANQLYDRFWIEGTGDRDLYAGEFGDFDFEPYNTTRFRLSTSDGTVFIVDERWGLLEMRDLSGNTLVLNRDAQNRVTGVTSTQNAPGGPLTSSVTIVRDATGRVDYIRDAAGKDLDYLYDAQGRLASFTDRETHTTQFRYEHAPLPHYLTKILDPRGVTALRNEFDPVTGKLVKQIDADGRETIFNRGAGVDAASRFEKIKDRLGQETTFFYDERGNVITKIDPLGAQTTYSYWPDSDRVKFETDHYGNVMSFAYDARGNVTVQTIGASTSEDPASPTTGYITRTVYNAHSAPTQMIDPDGRIQAFTYHATTNELLTHTLGFGGAAPASTTYTYNSDGTPATITDPLGNVTSHTYNYTFSDPAYPGAVKQTTVTVSDPAGTAGSDSSNVNTIVLRQSRTLLDRQENQLAQIVTRTLPGGGTEEVVTRFIYDAENRLRATILPDGRVTETRYTSFGKEEKSVLWPTLADYQSGNDALARITSYTYDARGNQTSVTYPDSTTELTAYDLENRKAWSQDRRGYRTFFLYDQLGRLRFTIQPDANDGVGPTAPNSADDTRLTDNPRTETQYDLVGRVRFQIDERGVKTEFTYQDGCACAMRRSQMIQHRAAGNLITRYEYDQAGNVRFVTDPRGHTTETRYDDHGRPTRVIHPATDEHPVTETRTDYDKLGRRTAVTDQEGKITRYRYDALGRLIEVRQYLDQSLAVSDLDFNLAPSTANVVSTRFAYDELGAQTAQIDALGRTTTYESDPLGRRIKRILPKDASETSGLAESLAYDMWGNLWKRTDFAGKTTTFAYDALNRLKSKTADSTHPSLGYSHAIARIEYDYDANGTRTAARTFNASNVPLYAETTPRDERGRIDYKDVSLPTTARLDYEYHANNLLKAVDSSNDPGVSVGYRYDELNRLEHVDDLSTGLPTRTTSYTYNPSGSLATLTQPNGVVHSYGYDALNRLRTLIVSQPSALNPQPVIHHTYDYQLRASGHRRQLIEGPRTISYTYDELYRLTGETRIGDTSGQNGTIGYTLDKVGNRLSRLSPLPSVQNQTNSFNSRDWLGGDTYTPNGSTLTSSQHSALNPQLAGTDTYDFEERLILRTRADGTTINLSYDADGHRIGKNILNASGQPVSSTSWLVDTNNLTGYAQVFEERVSTLAGTTLRVYTYGTDLISQATRHASASTFTLNYFGYDGHGSVRELTDAFGEISDRYDYDAFGNLVFSSGTTANAYRYCGEQYDPDLGLYYLRARYLNADSGRFWTMDSYEGSGSDPMSLHKYLYAHVNPVMLSDPSGHMALSSVMATFSVVAKLYSLAVMTLTTVQIAMDVVVFRAIYQPLLDSLKIGMMDPHGVLHAREQLIFTKHYNKVHEKALTFIMKTLVKSAVIIKPVVATAVVGITTLAVDGFQWQHLIPVVGTYLQVRDFVSYAKVIHADFGSLGVTIAPPSENMGPAEALGYARGAASLVTHTYDEIVRRRSATQ
jgi:RHS repeat-associated protein